jgi:integrase
MDRHFEGIGHIWERIRAKANLNDVRLHDLRHTFASKGISLSIGLPIIGGLLGHSLPSTTAKYAHLAADPARWAGERIASQLRAELEAGAGQRSAEVISLKRAPGLARTSRAHS